MKAAFCTAYGPPEVLEIREIPKPQPKPNQILVKVMASAVNSGDVRVRGLVVSGILKLILRIMIGFSKPRKPILGTVFSGTVESLGKNVKGFSVGDEVFGSTGFQFGTYAEYLCISEKGVVILKPESASFEEAAAISFGGQSAVYFLDKAKLKEKPNAKVLIIGATGSVGVAAVQIAQYYKSEITAVCSSAGESLGKELGVRDIILYDKEDFTKTERQFDLIFDAVGKASKKQCQHLLKPRGIYKTVEGMDVADESKEQLEFLKYLFDNGKLKAVIDKMYPFEQIKEAHRYVDKGHKKGNVVLKLV